MSVNNYTIESEIDNAIPYLDKLNDKIKILKEKQSEIPKKKAFNFFKAKEKIPVIIIPKYRRKLYCKDFIKDGYMFRIILNLLFEKDSDIKAYEFYISIIYTEDIKRKEFNKIFKDLDSAKNHYDNWANMLKIINRRDIMEMLFEEKLKEIEELSK